MPPKPSINPIRAFAAGEQISLPKLSHVIAERLRSQVISGHLPAGQQLPSEVQLEKLFKVSRPIVREALRILESESLIAVSRGARSGATVLEPTVARAAEYAADILAVAGTTIADVHTARMFLEPSIVGNLAKTGNVDVVQRLSDCADRVAALTAARDYKAAVVAMSEFHELLIRYSGNQTLILLAGILRFVLAGEYPDIVISNLKDDATFHRRLEETVKSYRQLIELIEKGKPRETEAFWRAYMKNGREFLTRLGIDDKPINRLRG
jgi:GntR family transcriptional regulator, transcriptional repressor for pyruvate dehydrogenase complex